ncbi:MAG: sugar ABC transporter ATP-binding protein [Streptosporangiaceae bacterium]
MADAQTAPPVLEVFDVTKDYPGTRALDEVSISFAAGQVTGILGQNGAGKSTLVRILSGAEQPSRGHISLQGSRVRFATPAHAQQAGVATVYQELRLIPSLSVAENICLGNFPKASPVSISWSQMRTVARENLGRLGFDLNPRLAVESLSVAEKQAVEIAKALCQQARVLILDEPTATLSRPEAKRFLGVVRGLRDDGLAVVYISHRMDEVEDICDVLAIMRNGRLVDVRQASQMTREEVVRRMLGRASRVEVGGDESTPVLAALGERMGGCAQQEVALEVEDLSAGSVLDAVHLELRRGEVLGITGLTGSGQAELAECLFGARSHRGVVRILGKQARLHSPAAAIRAGVGLVPEDRKTQGLVLGMPVRSNVTMAALHKVRRLGFISRRKERRFAEDMKRELGIRVADLGNAVSTLSGGNQQKVVFGKWLTSGVSVLVLDEPTRGVDVGAKVEIYRLINGFLRSGGSCLLITSDIEEALLCDRVAVLRRGAIVGTVSREQIDADGEEPVLALCG